MAKNDQFFGDFWPESGAGPAALELGQDRLGLILGPKLAKKWPILGKMGDRSEVIPVKSLVVIPDP